LPNLTEKISSTFEIDRFKIKIKIVESHVICVAVGNPAEIKVSQTISTIIIGNKAKCMWLTFKKTKVIMFFAFSFLPRKLGSFFILFLTKRILTQLSKKHNSRQSCFTLSQLEFYHFASSFFLPHVGSILHFYAE
jgi:hypothetical protein